MHTTTEQVYMISTPHGPRYIRARSEHAARVRAFKVWKAANRATVCVGNSAPDNLGRFGYDSAVNSVDTMPTHAAHKGSSSALRGFYVPSKAKRQRVANEAARILALLVG